MDYCIDNIRPLRVISKIIESTCYNHVRLALHRIDNPLRIKLPGHRGLDIILNNRNWLCVDSIHDDQLIMAWGDFDTRNHNKALHEAVPCKLRLYHINAGLVMGSALDALDKTLAEKLSGNLVQSA
ncbi:MAG TPA: hypothetical protein VIQ03_02630 [Gammaproteobacteria bacterium]